MKSFIVFKQFSQILAMSAIIASAVLFCNSCRKAPLSSSPEIETETSFESIPTEDLVSKKCSLPTFISPNVVNDNALASALKKRFTNVSSTITPDTKVIFIDAKDILSLVSSDTNFLAEAYKNDARILISNPKLSNINDIDDYISSGLINLSELDYDDIESIVSSTLVELDRKSVV